MRQPLDIPKHHDRPPPKCNRCSDLPVNKKVGSADQDIQPKARSDLVSEKWDLKAKFDLGPPVAHHNVPGVKNDGHAHDMDNLVHLVAVEFAIVKNHVIPVHAFVLCSLLPLKLGQSFLDASFALCFLRRHLITSNY